MEQENKKEIANFLNALPNEPSAMVQIEQSRAAQEVQAALVIAKKFPRDTNEAFTRIIDSCKRVSLAEKSMYQYPRGGETVKGPSIRLAEVLAQNWGNIDFGWREIERKKGATVCEAYCWDLQTNTKQSVTFEVPHEIALKKGIKKVLTDPRDIYEIAANMASRRRRACILGIIPSDVVEAAVNMCRETLAKGRGEPIADRIRKVILAFKELGVSQEMLENRLGHQIDLTTTDEIVDLTAIFTSIRDKQAKRGDFFEFPDEDEGENSKAASLKEKLKGNADA